MLAQKVEDVVSSIGDEAVVVYLDPKPDRNYLNEEANEEVLSICIENRMDYD